MDKNFLILASEAVAHLELKRLREARKKIERDPKPLPVDLSGWATEMQTSLKAQMETSARSIVHKAKTEIESIFSVDALKTGVLKVFHMNLNNEIEGPLLLQYLPLLQKEMEAILYAREMQGFNSRFESVDGHIRQWQGKIPKPFDKSLINVDPRFPIDRVGFLQERVYDRWLTDALKSKPIFFDSPDYVEKLTVFFETIYKPMDQSEKNAKEPIKVEELKPEPPPIQGKTDKSVLAKEDEGTDSALFVNRHPKFQA